MNTSVKELNALSPKDATALFARCCGSSRWAAAMSQSRPFSNLEEIQSRAAQIWSEMHESDFLEAFSHHPKIGASLDLLREKFASTHGWSSAEQSAVTGASEETLAALRDGNIRYEKKYGFIFIVCATGKSAAQMLEILNSRMNHSYEQELQIAAKEQAKITHLRLEKI